jgi:hypothetical protein
MWEQPYIRINAENGDFAGVLLDYCKVDRREVLKETLSARPLAGLPNIGIEVVSTSQPPISAKHPT